MSSKGRRTLYGDRTTYFRCQNLSTAGLIEQIGEAIRRLGCEPCHLFPSSHKGDRQIYTVAVYIWLAEVCLRVSPDVDEVNRTGDQCEEQHGTAPHNKEHFPSPKRQIHYAHDHKPTRNHSMTGCDLTGGRGAVEGCTPSYFACLLAHFQLSEGCWQTQSPCFQPLNPLTPTVAIQVQL